MINFPNSTYVNKNVPKNAFYQHLEVNSSMKSHFVNDVESIIWANKLVPSTLNVAPGKNVKEITVFAVKLKSKDCPDDVFIFIDKNLPRHTIFVLTYETEHCILVNYKEANSESSAMPFKVTNSYRTPWLSESELSLIIQGNNMDAIYENAVRYIAGTKIVETSSDLKADIEKTAEHEQLIKQITILKSKMNSERQPQKKYAYHKQIKELEKKL